MKQIDWASHLQELSRFVLEEEDNTWIGPEYRERGYLGFPGANEAEILAEEARLGTRFPASYRAFLRASNGWGAMGAGCPGKLWSAAETEWLSVRNRATIDTWGDRELSADEHLEYQGQDPVWYNGAYMRGALEISDWGDACILFLCPDVVTPEGEWECWELASWHPGAARYASFQDWFLSTRDQLQSAL